jgi:hypothetical protein
MMITIHYAINGNFHLTDSERTKNQRVCILTYYANKLEQLTLFTEINGHDSTLKQKSCFN